MRLWWMAPLLALVACADVADGSLDPEADDDNDGYSNLEEQDLGSDPLDAEDVPYEGGWVKDTCRDSIVATGNDVGDVAENFTLEDQFGQEFNLHDFCGKVVLIEFSGFT